MKKLSIVVSVFAFSGSVLAMEGNANDFQLQKFVEGYSKVLTVVGGLDAQAQQTLHNAMVRHFDLNDAEVQKYVACARNDFDCIVQACEDQELIKAGLVCADTNIQECETRQKELLGEVQKVQEACEKTQLASVACNDKYREELSANNEKLNSAGAWFCACFMKAKTALYKNKLVRGTLSGARFGVPAVLVGNVGVNAFATCAESAVECVLHPFRELTLWIKLAGGAAGFLGFQFLHQSAQEVLTLIKEREKLEEEYLRKAKEYETQIEDFKNKQGTLQSEQKAKLEASEKANELRRKYEAEQKDLDAKIAEAVGAKVATMNARNIQLLEKAAAQDQNDEFVHDSVVNSLKNVMDVTLIGAAAVLKSRDRQSLLTLTGASVPNNNNNKSNAIEDVTDK